MDVDQQSVTSVAEKHFFFAFAAAATSLKALCFFLPK
jgi:hypothetical protein